MNFRTLKTTLTGLLSSIAVVMFLFSSLAGQSGTTGVRGTVADQNGGAIPGTTVTLSNPETGFTRSVTTDNEGRYAFTSLPPATYQLEVSGAGFKKLVRRELRALVDSPVEINLVLEPGDVTVTVDVTSDIIGSIVNTQDASIGNNFVPQQITQLPTNLRRVTDLLTLQPGVTREGYVAGGRSDQANITLDGVDINDQQNGGRTDQFQTSQSTVLRLTAEAVEEFRITTTGANANQGRSSGAQISLVTKGGTNDFRGAVYYFYRPTAFSSNSFFNNLSGVERGSLARPVFGGALGGPIWKNRAFFFYSFEGQREKRDSSVVRLVPLAHMGMGQMRFFGAAPGDPAGTNRLVTITTTQFNGIFSQVGINPAAVAVFASAAARYPANDTSVGDGINTGGYRFNAPQTIDEDTHIARFDFKLSNSQQLMIRGNYQNDLTNSASAFPDTPSPATWSHPYGAVAGHTWTISNNRVNSFRYGLTRQAFSTQGDSAENAISFRFVFSPLLFGRTLSRVTSTHNITNDFSWVKGRHSIQLGGNVRIIRNKRTSFGSAFDAAVTNPSFYDQSGGVVDAQITGAGYTIGPGQRAIAQAAATALIGRFSQYSGNFTFDIDGSVLPPGTPSTRNFATEEYDVYGQDVWKPFSNLTITGGLRYGLSRPVYETNGFQVVPTERLGEFFERRVASANLGRPLNDLIAFQLGGPKNGKPGFYSMDKNNFQPRIAAAWSPKFRKGVLGAIFGDNGESVIRGGFSIMNDYFGQQLAVSFDALSTIGFTSSTTISANTYNVTDRPAPQFTGFNQNIRSLPGIPAPVQRFSTAVDPACLAGTVACPQRIESSLDATIKSPIHYSWNVSWGRRLPKGLYFETSYIGRRARNLFAARDIMALNNIVDPASGMDWFSAAGILHDLRAANTPIHLVPTIPYFQNLFPGYTTTVNGVPLTSTQRIYRLVARDGLSGPVGGGFDILDWTFIQLIIDDRGIYPNMFFHPQYAAFSAFGTTAYSDYHAGTFSLRQRLRDVMSFDINYTFAKSLDNASGLQTGGSYGSQFILNPLQPRDNYAVSDFDIRHSVNANFLFQFPIGKGKKFFNNMNGVADAFLGGWQLSSIFRWNSGLPLSTPFDAEQWATNWNVQSNGTRIRRVDSGAVRSTQNLFADPQAALNSFRNARPGETGERNTLRLPGFASLDLGLSKTVTMPWNESHKLQLRVETFNVLNHQFFSAGNFTR
ncbi:MAG: carboxypeptidase-like regulatory domain-containing protein, partial [Acidobacteriota bacterium]